MARTELRGTAASPGVGVGRALFLPDPDEAETTTAPAIDARVPLDPAIEAERLRAALEATAIELAGLAAQTARHAGADAAEILEAQALMARDPAIVDAASAAVAAGAPAEEAVLAAAARQSERLAALDDPYFRARAADVTELARRVADWLAGRSGGRASFAGGGPAVVIAEDLGPADTALLGAQRVAAIALAGGSLVGHAAIVARALELPLVLGLGAALLGVGPGAVVLVDGSRGLVIVDPDDGDVRA